MTLDVTALCTPVPRAEVSRFRRAAKASGAYRSAANAVATVAVVAGALVVGGIAISMIVAAAFLAFGASAYSTGPLFLVVPFGFLAVLAVIVGVMVAAAVRGRGGGWERLLRQVRFAEANGLVFSRFDANPRYPGAIFALGESRAAVDHYRSIAGRALDFGNYRYTVGSGRNRSTRTWGFLALQLDRALPHMVLDATSNNGPFGVSNLPAGFRRNQVLSLEGNFDRYFRLYCPREYERDALYVFTPDLMALLIDNAHQFDVEIIDTWMFVYSSTPFTMHDAEEIGRLGQIIDTVGEKTLARTDRYADHRAVSDAVTTATVSAGADGEAAVSPGAATPFPANTVAPGGRRLVRRVPVPFLALGVAVIVFAIARLYIGL